MHEAFVAVHGASIGFATRKPARGSESEGPFAGTDSLFGDFTIDYSEGHLVFTAPAVPGLGGKTMAVEGDFAGDSFSGTCTIIDLAEGTFESTRA